jgi:hypothetical protein
MDMEVRAACVCPANIKRWPCRDETRAAEQRIKRVMHGRLPQSSPDDEDENRLDRVRGDLRPAWTAWDSCRYRDPYSHVRRAVGSAEVKFKTQTDPLPNDPGSRLRQLIPNRGRATGEQTPSSQSPNAEGYRTRPRTPATARSESSSAINASGGNGLTKQRAFSEENPNRG